MSVPVKRQASSNVPRLRTARAGDQSLLSIRVIPRSLAPNLLPDAPAPANLLHQYVLSQDRSATAAVYMAKQGLPGLLRSTRAVGFRSRNNRIGYRPPSPHTPRSADRKPETRTVRR
jgi:hypothetical protein